MSASPARMRDQHDHAEGRGAAFPRARVAQRGFSRSGRHAAIRYRDSDTLGCRVRHVSVSPSCPPRFPGSREPDACHFGPRSWSPAGRARHVITCPTASGRRCRRPEPSCTRSRFPAGRRNHEPADPLTVLAAPRSAGDDRAPASRCCRRCSIGSRTSLRNVVVYDALSVWGRIASEHLGRRRRQAVGELRDERAGSRTSWRPGAGPCDGQRARGGAGSLRGPTWALSRPPTARPRLNVGDLFMQQRAADESCFAPRAAAGRRADTFGARYLFAGSVAGAPVTTKPLDPLLDDFGARAARCTCRWAPSSNDWPAVLPASATRRSPGATGGVLVAGTDGHAGRPPACSSAGHVPQLANPRPAPTVVRHATAGMNSVMEALAHGVPMVLVPQMPSRPITAEAHRRGPGGGRVIRREALTPGKPCREGRSRAGVAQGPGPRPAAARAPVDPDRGRRRTGAAAAARPRSPTYARAERPFPSAGPFPPSRRGGRRLDVRGPASRRRRSACGPGPWADGGPGPGAGARSARRVAERPPAARPRRGPHSRPRRPTTSANALARPRP